MTSNWTILGRYPFSLLPATETVLPGGVKSYYHYLNEEPHETGKNVQIIAWLIKDLPTGLQIVDPFGGCGVFAVAVNEILKPSKFLIGELDDSCIDQLCATFADHPNVRVYKADAREAFESESFPKGDIYVCDFPRFTLRRHQTENRWAPELARMFSAKPRALIMSDGSAHLNHFVRNAFKKSNLPVGDNMESFVKYASTYFYDLYGYSIVACGYHGNCFYYRLEQQAPGEIAFWKVKSGTYKLGLCKVKS